MNIGFPSLVARNSRRIGKARIPEKGIFGTRKRLRVPSFEEGFDEIHRVRIDEAGSFVVEGWPDEREDEASR